MLVRSTATDQNTRPRLVSMHDELCRYDQTSKEEELTIIASGQPSGANPRTGASDANLDEPRCFAQPIRIPRLRNATTERSEMFG
jgi:hypothetical protein